MNNTIERKDNLEVRWTRNLISSKRYPEIVKWEEFSNAEIVEELCYTLAYWIRSEQHPLIDDVHWDLKFVGNRPFAVEIDRDVVWSMMKKTQTMLDALEQEDEEDDGKWKQEEERRAEMSEDWIRKIVRDEIKILKSNENQDTISYKDLEILEEE
jgi:hypothetical protein|tara:strand:+ start:148 stop:612 length:465 start_codon:yes stop_codon:yes gene_type:complete